MKHDQKLTQLAEMPAFDPAKPFVVIPHANGGWSIASLTCTPAGAQVIAAYSDTVPMVQDITAALLPPTGEADTSDHDTLLFEDVQDLAKSIAEMVHGQQGESQPGPDDWIAFDLVKDINRDPEAVRTEHVNRWAEKVAQDAKTTAEGYFAKRFMPPEGDNCPCEHCAADREAMAREAEDDSIADLSDAITRINRDMRALRVDLHNAKALARAAHEGKDTSEGAGTTDDDLATMWQHIEGIWAALTELRDGKGPDDARRDPSVNERFVAVWDELRKLKGAQRTQGMRADVQSSRLDTLARAEQDRIECDDAPVSVGPRQLTAQDIVDAFRGDQKLYDECLRLLRTGAPG